MISLPFDLSVTRITRNAIGLGLIGVIVVYMWMGARDAIGFLVGATISVLTVRSWFKLASSLGTDGSVPGGPAAIFLVLRYLLIAGAIYATIKGLGSSPAVLIVGLLVSFVAVLVDLLYAMAAPKASKSE